MSGGSYTYFYAQDGLSNLTENLHRVEEMRDRLIELGTDQGEVNL
jgi:ribosomal 50S subunit-associated protein YjgA (DUF615 family)